MLDRDDTTNEAIVTIHWNGGRHTEMRVSRVRSGRYPADRHSSPVTAIRTLGGQLPDRELAVTLNRMRCKPGDGKAWTAVRVRELRERLGIDAFDPALPRAETISADATATRLGICIGSVHKLIRRGLLPAAQLMPSAPWQIPVAALDTEAVKTGVCEIVSRRSKFYKRSGIDQRQVVARLERHLQRARIVDVPAAFKRGVAPESRTRRSAPDGRDRLPARC